MIDLASAFSSLKIASDIGMSLLKMNIDHTVKEKVIELQNTILSVQSIALEARQEQLEYQDKIKVLENEIAILKKTKLDFEKYELKDVGKGGLVYNLKDEFLSDSEAHWLCVHCYDSGEKSILQSTAASGHKFYCPKCKNEISVRTLTNPNYDKILRLRALGVKDNG